jgi:hypothetical protein
VALRHPLVLVYGVQQIERKRVLAFLLVHKLNTIESFRFACQRDTVVAPSGTGTARTGASAAGRLTKRGNNRVLG